MELDVGVALEPAIIFGLQPVRVYDKDRCSRSNLIGSIFTNDGTGHFKGPVDREA